MFSQKASVSKNEQNIIESTIQIILKSTAVILKVGCNQAPAPLRKKILL